MLRPPTTSSLNIDILLNKLWDDDLVGNQSNLWNNSFENDIELNELD
jgi:hypothetical protein